MNEGLNNIRYGRYIINYYVKFTNRKTLEIAVHPDKQIIVSAPVNCDLSKIREKIIKRAKWIIKQIRFFSQFDPRTPSKYFLNGETHLYLGKHYRLKIKTGLNESVKLKNGYFIIVSRAKEDQKHIKELINNWYYERSLEKFNEYFNLSWRHFYKTSPIKPIIKIRKMKKRWGSLSKGGILTLNLELIKAPKDCIEYVIVHELCHMKYHSHNSEFYNQLSKIIPEWEKTKNKLEITMS